MSNAFKKTTRPIKHTHSAPIRLISIRLDSKKNTLTAKIFFIKNKNEIAFVRQSTSLKKPKNNFFNAVLNKINGFHKIQKIKF